jgi:hypothetical protein
MPRIVVNNVDQSPHVPVETWGDLLADLERGFEGSGEVVSAVRFDGIVENSFRDPTVAARSLADFVTVEIDAHTPRELVASTVADARGWIDALCFGARTVAEAFRANDLTAGNQGLVELGEALRALVGLVHAAARTLDARLELLPCGDTNAAVTMTDLMGHLDGLVDAQQSADWVAVADVLEYDLEPSIREWDGLLKALSDLAKHTHA